MAKSLMYNILKAADHREQRMKFGTQGPSNC